MISWRLVHERFASTAFDGEGARLYGGRWNHRGQKVVYTSGAISLATLELLAGLPSIKILDAYVCIPVDMPSEVILDVDALPEGWDSIPAGSISKDIGSAWIQEGLSPVLKVPSVIIPSEMNYLLNPVHPDFGKLKIYKPRAFRFDPRFS